MLLRVENKVPKMIKTLVIKLTETRMILHTNRCNRPHHVESCQILFDKGRGAEQSEPREVQLPPAMHDITDDTASLSTAPRRPV